MKGKTSIVIAHRLSTVRAADIIFVVKDGSIAEQGRHEDLIASGGIYSGFYGIQFGEPETLDHSRIS
jgi:ATP-binding cassette subfamily B protein